MIVNKELSLHPNGLPHGTIRRAPAPSFAHAILLDQGERGAGCSWLVIDIYGPSWEAGDRLSSEENVAHWPIVYVPVEDTMWAKETEKFSTLGD